jgi:hypothetical protein
MAKFHGTIGYILPVETAPGVYTESVTERTYYGDIVRNIKRLEKGESLNDNLNINNLFSIIADDFSYQNFQAMRYIRYMGSLWKITNVEIQRPRLILTVGGVYNGP